MYAVVRNEISSMFYYRKMVKNISKKTLFQRSFRFLSNNKQSWLLQKQNFLSFDSPSGMPGSGAGKGGGAGGSVRDSGGKLGEYGAAQEEHYFFNKQKEQLEKLKKKLKSDKPGELTQKHDK